MGKRILTWDMEVIKSSKAEKPGWIHVVLSCGHECDLQLGDYPVPKNMRCIPCKHETAAQTQDAAGIRR